MEMLGKEDETVCAFSWSHLKKEYSSSTLSNLFGWGLICMLDRLQWTLWNAARLCEPRNGWGCGIVSSCISTSSCKGSYGNSSIWVRTLLNKQQRVHPKEEIQVSSRWWGWKFIHKVEWILDDTPSLQMLHSHVDMDREPSTSMFIYL